MKAPPLAWQGTSLRGLVVSGGYFFEMVFYKPMKKRKISHEGHKGTKNSLSGSLSDVNRFPSGSSNL